MPSDGEPERSTVSDVPVCPGCGFAAHITHGDICGECFQRREGWLGGGGLRVVPSEGDIHETPLCPDFDGGTWSYWLDESALYHTMSPTNDVDYCETCRHHRLTGFSTDEEPVTDGGTSETESDEHDVNWVESVPERLVEDRDLAFRVDRDGYVAFVYATGYHEFELVHRHYHEDEWRTESIAKTSLLGSVARFDHCGRVVEMPALDDVEVTRHAE